MAPSWSDFVVSSKSGESGLTVMCSAAQSVSFLWALGTFVESLSKSFFSR